MNLLEVHVIFIHIISDQQLSRIFPSNTFTQDHIATLKFKTVDTPFQFQGEDFVIDSHSYVLHTHFTSLSNTHLKHNVSNIIVAMSSKSYSGDSRNGGKAVVKTLFHQNMK